MSNSAATSTAAGGRRRNNWSKQVTVLLAAICVALASVSGYAAQREDDFLLQVEGVPISHALYSYFVSEALYDTNGNLALDKNGRPESITKLRDDVKRRCTEFVAITSELYHMKRGLSMLLKAQVSDRTAHLWRSFGTYYTSIGVDRQTINTVLAGKAAREQLFRAIYDDPEGPRQVPEEAIQAYFYGNYVKYTGMRVYQTVLQPDGSERKMTAAEKANLRVQLDNFVAACNEPEADFFSLAQTDYAETLNYAVPEDTTVKKGGGELPDNVIEQVRAFGEAKVSLLDAGGFFLVGKGINMRKDEQNNYQVFRMSCLKDLRGEEYEGLLPELFSHYRADENVTAVDRLLRRWDWTPIAIVVTTTEPPTTAAMTTSSAAATTTKKAATTTKKATTTRRR